MKIYDDEWCADGGPFGGRCFTLLSDHKRIIAPEIWNQIPSATTPTVSPDSRFGRVCGSVAAFGHIKGSLLKLCQAEDDCTVEEIKKLQAIQVNLDKIVQAIEIHRKTMVAR